MSGHPRVLICRLPIADCRLNRRASDSSTQSALGNHQSAILMRLHEFLSDDAIDLTLRATQKDEVLLEMIRLLKLDEAATSALFRMARRREHLGSTGVGRGIAIPHCRAPAIDHLRLAFGRTRDRIEYQSIDDQPVRFLFLIVAPPVEVSNNYLPVLGKIAQFAKEPDVPDRLLQITSPKEFLALLEEKGV